MVSIFVCFLKITEPTVLIFSIFNISLKFLKFFYKTLLNNILTVNYFDNQTKAQNLLYKVRNVVD